MFGLFDNSLNELLAQKEELGRMKCIGEVAKRLNQMKDRGDVLTYKALGDMLESLNIKRV